MLTEKRLRAHDGLGPRLSRAKNTITFWLHFFFLHLPSILEPNFDLSLVQTQRRSDFYSPSSGEVLVKVELLLQLGQLSCRKSRSSRSVADGSGRATRKGPVVLVRVLRR